MAVDKNYERLGLFLVVALVVGLAAAGLFLQRLRSRPVIAMVTYMDDNVSGLDVSSPVRFKGVNVGRVADVRLDPTEQIIEVDFELFLDRITTIGGNAERMKEQAERGLIGRLRAQVVGNPVTGEAYLLLDIPANAPPPMALKFTPTNPYVPSVPSPRSMVEGRLPAVLDRAEAALQTFGEIVARMPDSLDRSDRFFTNVERIVREADLPALSADSRRFFSTTSAQMERVSSNLEAIVGPEGTLTRFVEETRGAIKDSDLPGTSEAARAASDRTVLAADELARALPALRESLQELRDLARLLADQPEAVLYGPKQPKKGESRLDAAPGVWR